jgi:TatD DNase family protein
MIPLIDTHAHLDIQFFQTKEKGGNKEDRGVTGSLYAAKEMIKRAKEGILSKKIDKRTTPPPSFSVRKVLVPGITAESSRDVVALSRAIPELAAAVGYQPNGVQSAREEDWHAIVELAEKPQVVGIGETGLDRYWDDSPIELQIEWFQRHLDLAQQMDLPIIIHCREAWEDLQPMLERAADRAPLRGVIHAFSGNAYMAKTCVDLGLHISFAGPVTYRNKKFSPLWEAAEAVPDDRLLVETDSPYLTPHPFRGKVKPNEPAMVVWVALRLAELRGQSLEAVAVTTTQNAERLFRL